MNSLLSLPKLLIGSSKSCQPKNVEKTGHAVLFFATNKKQPTASAIVRQYKGTVQGSPMGKYLTVLLSESNI